MPTLRPRRAAARAAETRLRPKRPQVNDVIEILWEDRNEVFRGVISEYKRSASKHLVLYEDGDILYHDLDEYYWKPVGSSSWIVPFSGGMTQTLNIRENKDVSSPPRRKRRRRIITEETSSDEGHASALKNAHTATSTLCQESATPQLHSDAAQSSSADVTADSREAAEVLTGLHQMCYFARKNSYARSEARTEQSFSELLSPTITGSDLSPPCTPLQLASSQGDLEKKKSYDSFNPSHIPPRKRKSLLMSSLP